ncbi:porin [Paraburkholderia sp. J63]|uniref:porin n=1 Tax=Paraburkholderia sp. J63 TaxID=2805434 RepID=UPI002ABE51AB|nr:porin [Paraburkholderia sp. J63]
MKRLRGFAVASIVYCVAQTACAQNSVTLYGIFDQGILAVTNAGGGHVYQSSGSWLSGSRWGLRGSEDLGGGLKSIFVLESGFDGSSGSLTQGGRFFGRQAFVGLSGGYGSLTFGRQYDEVVEHLSSQGMTPYMWGGAFACHPGDVDNVCMSRRMDNSVKYASGRIDGFSFGAAYSFGGVPGQFSRGSTWSIGGDYAAGPVTIGVGYFNVNSPNTQYYNGAVISGTTNSYSNGFSASPVYSGFATANRQQTLATGINYTLGKSTLGAVYSYTKFGGLGTYNVVNTPALTGSAAVQNFELRYSGNITPSLVIGIAFNYTTVGSVGDISGARYRQIDLGVNYFLSKRTTLYAVFAGQSANGENSLGQPAVAALAYVTPSKSNRQAAAQIGIRHAF